MLTVTYDDGNPVRVVILIPELKVKSGFFGRDSIIGNFETGMAGDAPAFVAKASVSNFDINLCLTEWSLDVDCKAKNSVENPKYTCRQFPGPIVPSDAKYKIKKGKIILMLPKADPLDSWAGALAARGLDQFAA